MATKAAALNTWLSGFGLKAYDENRVPGNAVYPYLTYTPAFGAFGAGDYNIPVKQWYQTEDNVTINAKAEQIGQAIGQTGAQVEYTGGYMMIFRGSPFSQPFGDPSDKTFNCRYINLTARYYSEY